MHLHSLYSDGTATVSEILDWVEQRTDLDVIAITDHERIDGAQRALELHAAGSYSFDLVVGEEITTRRGHLLALFLSERVPALRSLPDTLERVHGQGAVAIAAHPLGTLTPSIGERSLRAADADDDPAHRLHALEMVNPSAAGRVRTDARRRLQTELALPGVGNSDAHVVDGIGTAWTWFPGRSAEDYLSALLEGRTEGDGEFWSNAHNVAVYRRQLAAKLQHLRHTLRPTGEWR